MDTTQEDFVLDDLTYLVCSRLSEDDDVISDQIRLEIAVSALAHGITENAKLVAAFSTLPLQFFVNLIRQEAKNQLVAPEHRMMNRPCPISLAPRDANMLEKMVRKALLRLGEIRECSQHSR